MEGIVMDIQLIIKAPSQYVEDHVVYCNLDWTVQKLKNHLSEVYPSKPVSIKIVHEQKLIYSGRLLHDQLYLKDVLRHEDERSPVHILHLVYSCQNCNQGMLQNQDPCSSQNLHGRPVQSENSPVTNETPEPASETLLRFRPGQQASESSFQQYSQFPQNFSTLPLLSNPEFIAQMANMQQMYSYYFAQYMQNMHTAGKLDSCHAMQEFASNFQQIHTSAPNIAANDVPVQRPVNADQRMNPQGGPALEDNDDFGNRDWLEKFFLYCRCFILFSIVYFYSTPERLMIVIVFAILAFLYHEGWFVRRPSTTPINNQRRELNENNVERNPNPGYNSNELSPDNQNPSANEMEYQNGHELEVAMDGVEPPHYYHSDMANNNRFISPFTLIAAFFSSLIPEPPPPVNMN